MVLVLSLTKALFGLVSLVSLAMSNPPQIPSEDSFFELLAETLENMEHGARGQFLRQFFNTVTQLDLTESVSSEYWKRILQRRQELAYCLGKPVSLKTAMLDVLASSTLLRVPVMMEYDQLKELQVKYQAVRCKKVCGWAKNCAN
jgi:hypothetical protein